MADQLTPRVVRTVEELGDVPLGSPIVFANGRIGEVSRRRWRDGARTPIVYMTGESGFWDPDTFHRETDPMFPATVLAPPSVTAEQVALITDPRYPDGRAFGPVFTDSVHEAFRRGVDTALAAMGITITTGGE